MLQSLLLFSSIEIRHYLGAQLSNSVKTKVLLQRMSFLASQYFLVTKLRLHGSVAMARFRHLLVFLVLHLWSCGPRLPVCVTHGVIPAPAALAVQEHRAAAQPASAGHSLLSYWDEWLEAWDYALLKYWALQLWDTGCWFCVLPAAAYGCSSCCWCGVGASLHHDPLCSIEDVIISIILCC